MFQDKIEQAYALAKKMVDRDNVYLPGSCIYHALAVREILGGEVVAGSMSWRFTNFDNGVNDTHFSYVFEPEKLAIYLAKGVFPEMHVWNKIDGKVLDLTTKFIPEQAKTIAGLIWSSPLPPAYHFGNNQDESYTYLYTEHPLASAVTHTLMLEINLGDIK